MGCGGLDASAETCSTDLPQILKNIRASPMMPPSFASLSADGLMGALRIPAPC